jgi:hypothetical protein
VQVWGAHSSVVKEHLPIMKPLLAGCALFLLGCGHAELPQVPAPPRGTDGEDCSIMAAVLNDFLRPRQDAAVRRGMGDRQGPARPTRFLLIDSTVAVCRHEPVWPPVAGCIHPEFLPLAERFGRRTTAAIESELDASIPIRCELGADVRYLPASTTRLQPSLFQEHPSALIAFSAPVYVNGTTAVIFYRHFFMGGGFVRLEFSGTAWQVRESSRWLE